LGKRKKKKERTRSREGDDFYPAEMLGILPSTDEGGGKRGGKRKFWKVRISHGWTIISSTREKKKKREEEIAERSSLSRWRGKKK